MTERNLIPGNTVETVTAHDSRDFGVADAKGRAIGGRVTFISVEYAAHTAEQIAEASARTGSYSGFLIPAQHAGKTRFIMRPQATRNGVAYGAWQRGTYCETPAEAQAAAEAYFAGAIKRAAKAAGRK